MYLCVSTVVDFNSQNFDHPLMKFDKYSPDKRDYVVCTDRGVADWLGLLLMTIAD